MIPIEDILKVLPMTGGPLRTKLVFNEEPHMLSYENMEDLAQLLAGTFTQLIAQPTSIGIYPTDGHTIDVKIAPVDKSPIVVTLANSDCLDLLDNPVSEASLDLLELIVDETDISFEEMKAAEQFFEIRDAFGS